MYEAEDIIHAVGAIFEHLDALLREESAEFRARIEQAFDETEDENDLADELFGILQSKPATRDWMRDYLANEVGESTATRSIQAEAFVTIPVFYGTDRKRNAPASPEKLYGRERGDHVEMGVCEVTIPKQHRVGAIDEPSIWRLEFRSDWARHVILQNVQPLDSSDFFSRLSSRLGSGTREIVVFVHGFNVSFAAAAKLTAQLAYDLMFGGAAVFYSWPSQARLSLAGYRHDAQNVRFTVPHLRQFLEALVKDSGAEAVHLIAHSMGNQALTEVLKDIALKLSPDGVPSVGEVILTAPDIDAEVFEGMAAEFPRSAGRVTMYVSDTDRALCISRRY